MQKIGGWIDPSCPLTRDSVPSFATYRPLPRAEQTEEKQREGVSCRTTAMRATRLNHQSNRDENHPSSITRTNPCLSVFICGVLTAAVCLRRYCDFLAAFCRSVVGGTIPFNRR